MTMIDVSKLSRTYAVRELREEDIEAILSIYEGNVLFFSHTSAQPTIEQVESDLSVEPPSTERSRKHYVGFFDGDRLIAVMDLIDGYPTESVAYIGLLMLDVDCQGKGIGTSLINDVLSYLTSLGTRSARLAIDATNPQSTHFWAKMGFEVVKEVKVDGWCKLVAERILLEPCDGLHWAVPWLRHTIRSLCAGRLAGETVWSGWKQ